MVGLILAAGNGQRLGAESGAEVCKPLLKIAGKYLIEYSLENLFCLKADKVFVVVGKYRSDIENVIGSDYKGIPVEYVEQKEPRGLVNAIYSALPRIDDGACLQLSDEIFVGADYSAVLDEVNGADFICGVTAEDNEEKIKGNYSVETDKNGFIISCKEKPKEVINNLKGTGFCVFDKNCLDSLGKKYDEGKNIPNDICDFINLLVSEGKRGKALRIAKKEYNINTSADRRQAELELSRKAVRDE